MTRGSWTKIMDIAVRRQGKRKQGKEEGTIMGGGSKEDVEGTSATPTPRQTSTTAAATATTE